MEHVVNYVLIASKRIYPFWIEKYKFLINGNDAIVTFQVVNDRVNNVEFVVFVVILWPLKVGCQT